MACFKVLVASDTCKGGVGLVKRAMFLATAALLAILILAPMAMAQDTTMPTQSASASAFGTPQGVGGGGRLQTPETGGPPTFLLPAAALLLGSGILTYAILRRR